MVLMTTKNQMPLNKRKIKNKENAMTKEEYFNQKSKYYYDMFLQNKYVRKVSTILKCGNKFLVLVKNVLEQCIDLLGFSAPDKM